MYRITYDEDGCRKTVWCQGRETSIILCQSLFQSPYVYTIALYDMDDNLVEVWGLV